MAKRESKDKSALEALYRIYIPGEPLDQKADEELRQLEHLQRQAIRNQQSRTQRRPHEIELCYIQRELHVRECRAKAAEEYNLQLQAEEATAAESRSADGPST